VCHSAALSQLAAAAAAAAATTAMNDGSDREWPVTGVPYSDAL